MKTPFILPVRIYYEDTDAGGVVYHSNYLNFFERARTEMLRNLGFEQNELRQKSGIIFAVRNIEIDYLRPAKFDDLIYVSAEILHKKKASLTFEQTIKCGEITLCTCSCRIACLNVDNLKPTAIPDFLFDAFLIKNNEH